MNPWRTRQTRRLIGAAAVAPLALLSGACESSSDDGESGVPRLPTQSISAYEDNTPQPATPRGLIAALLSHLEEADVASAGYADSVPGHVSVETKDGTSIGLTVSPAVPGSPATCALHARYEKFSGYEQVECRDDPFRFIGQRKPDKAMAEGMPEYEARTGSPRRGEVLLQVWTDQPRDEMVDLLRELLDDPHLGLRTTAGLNAQGAELDHLETFTIEGYAESDEQD